MGSYVLKRKRLLTDIMTEIKYQRENAPTDSTSIYLGGIRGSGKTTLLQLLARKFQSKGYLVYYISSANKIQGSGLSAPLPSNKKIAVLIDEVNTNPDSWLLTELLKGKWPKLVTIGAAIPCFNKSGSTAQFRKRLGMASLVLEDGDIQQLVEYWKDLNATTPELIESISSHLMKYCGGHIYPTVRFMEYFFTDEGAKNFIGSWHNFHKHFGSQEFAKSPVYEMVMMRCFDEVLESETAKTADRVLGGIEQSGDIETLLRIGWWNPVSRDFISLLLVNANLSRISPTTSGALSLPENGGAQEYIELIIIAGLNAMEASDFQCLQTKSEVKVEDGISFGWGSKVKANISNAFVSFQERASEGTGRVDFYINGVADCAIEVLLNAVRRKEKTAKFQSQDIDQHLLRFHGDKYAWSRFALLNFAMTKEIVLPTDPAHNDKVYTYVHSTNTLYRGEKAIKAPAVRAFPCPESIGRQTAKSKARKASEITTKSSSSKKTKVEAKTDSGSVNAGSGDEKDE